MPAAHEAVHRPSLWGVALFYGGMAAIGVVWSAYSRGTGMVLFDSDTLVRDGALGLGSGLVVVAASKWMNERSAAARELSRELHETLGVLSPWAIFVYAVTSSVGEEILFRGAMQPAIGYIATSVIFGAIHGFFVGKLRLWSFFAVAMGFYLGWMALYTGNLLAPVLAHFTTNLLNLHALNRVDVREAGP